jgi:hypothetical protein
MGDGGSHILFRRGCGRFCIPHRRFSVNCFNAQGRQGVYQVREYREARNTKALLQFEYPIGGFNDMMTRHEAASVIGIE